MLVAVGDFAVGAESCVVVEPGGVDLGEAEVIEDAAPAPAVEAEPATA